MIAYGMLCWAATILDFVGIFFEGWGWLVQLFEIAVHVFVL